MVLGSMPGAVSLAKGEYYAHPQNRFWRVMQEIVPVPASASYLERITMLTNAGVGLWDVLHSCERADSLDASIVAPTEEPNDFEQLLRAQPRIELFAFNGRKAASIFQRHVHLASGFESVAQMLLPSTSPANASVRSPELVERWRAILRHLPGR
jgi:TDG/mug DNA glycosylase family protein